MWDPNLNWLRSLQDSWITFSVVSVGALFALSVAGYFFVAKIEYALVKAGRWPRHFSFAQKFFLSAECFLVSLALLFVPSFVRMPEMAQEYLRGITRAGLLFSVAAILLKMADVTTNAYLRRLRLAKADNLRERKIATKIKYVEKIFDVLVVFIAIGLFLMGFDGFRRVGNSLLASAGLASLILGFAAQKSLGTLIAGLQVAFTQPIRIGDAVLVENEWGEIEEINLTYVVVRIWDLRRLVVPISYFLEKPFQNWTRTSADLVGSVLLPFDYSVPIEALRAELGRCLRASPLWDGKVNSLQVVDASDRAITVRALVSARNSGQTFELRCEVREKLLCFVREFHPEALPRARVGGIAGAGSGAKGDEGVSRLVAEA